MGFQQFVPAAASAAAAMTFASHVRQNHFNFTLDIWDKESIGLGKCTGLPFGDLEPRSLINKNLLVCRIKWEPLNQSLQNLVALSLWSW